MWLPCAVWRRIACGNNTPLSRLLHLLVSLAAHPQNSVMPPSQHASAIHDAVDAWEFVEDCNGVKVYRRDIPGSDVIGIKGMLSSIKGAFGVFGVFCCLPLVFVFLCGTTLFDYCPTCRH